MFSVLSTPEKLKFENAIGHFGTRAGKSPDRHVIKKESVFKLFFVHIKAQGQRFQILQFGFRSVFEKLLFHDGLVTVGLTVEVKLNFQISSSCVKQTTQIKQITGAVPFLKNTTFDFTPRKRKLETIESNNFKC